MISLIAAIGKNGEIGKNNELIWHIKEDMQYFKQMTLNHPVIMGFNTYKSIGRALPNRKNIVITKNNQNKINDKNIFVYDDIINFNSSKLGPSLVRNNKLGNLIKVLKDDEEYFIIGGSSIYQAFYDVADKLYLTEINAEDKTADSYFPKISIEDWHKKLIKHSRENNIEYDFVVYERLNK